MVKSGKVIKAENVVKKIEDFMTNLAGILRGNNYLIGHIKSFVKFENDSGVGLSVVKDKAHLKPQNYDENALVKNFNLALTAIVLNVPSQELEKIVEAGLPFFLSPDNFKHTGK
jgi:hypothetical protein